MNVLTDRSILNKASVSRTALWQSLRINSGTIINLGAAPSRRIQGIIDSSKQIFSRPEHEKKLFGCQNTLLGYRPKGIEFSKSPDRPDLIESLSYNPYLFEIETDNLPHTIYGEWVDRAHIVYSLFEALSYNIFLMLNEKYNITTCSPPRKDILHKSSFLQCNYYPFTSRRRILQDAHEDGNLFTLLWCTEPGLQAIVNGQPNDIILKEDEVYLFSGSILTEATDGEIAPLVHRVMKKKTSGSRISLMYFANFNTSLPEEEFNLTSIIRTTINRSSLFGLPKI